MTARAPSDRQAQGQAAILAAAATLLARHGYHGMSMRDLARSTHQSFANIYNYFASKDDLLFALQSRAFETLLASAASALEKADGAEGRLYAFIHNHVSYVAAHPDVMHVLVHEAGALSPERRQAMRRLKERYFRVGRDLIRALSAEHATPGATGDDRELERVTYSVFGMLNWLYGWYQPRRHGAAAAVARTIHGLVLSGLLNRHPDQGVRAATERRLAAVEAPSPSRLHAKGA